MGEASSKFVAAVGQTFYAPVTLTLLPGQKMYSLQMYIAVTNMDASPSVLSGSQYLGFNSMLEKPDPDHAGIYLTIPPSMYAKNFFWTNIVVTNVVMTTNLLVITTNTTIKTNTVLTNIIYMNDLITINTNNNLLLLGWLERAGATNLYDSTVQDLIKYSQPHDRIYNSADGKVIVGGYYFTIPPGSKPGDQFKISIGRPSATDDWINGDVYIDTPTNGSLAEGDMNSIKTVTVGTPSYLVGDITPFRWFNAGDFGDNDILNNDVLQVFQSAAYRLNYPPFNYDEGTDTFTYSDFFNAADSSNGRNRTDFYANDGDDTLINSITMGDGYPLGIDDIYVTWRRSLDPSLKWYVRFRDANGVLKAVEATNTFRGNPGKPSVKSYKANTTTVNSSEAPSVSFIAGDIQASPGETIYVPIEAQVHGPYPLRTLLLNVYVEALDDSPPHIHARFV